MKVKIRNLNKNLKAYFTLTCLICFSIGIGVYVFSKDIQDSTNNNNNNNEYAVETTESLESNVEQKDVACNGYISIEDIINKNKVVVEKMEEKEEKLEYETVTLGSRSGNSKIITEGSNGIQKNLYKVRYEDDVEVSKILVSSVVKTKPTNKVVQYESKGASISRSGTTVEREEKNSEEAIPASGYTKVIEMKFTSYCLCKKCTGKSPGDKGYGVTASGYVITPGKNQKVVAVDPKVIPLGSKVYVQGIGVEDYGYAIAADTGGAIKGNKIDLYIDSHGSGPWWTVGKVKVYVYE